MQLQIDGGEIPLQDTDPPWKRGGRQRMKRPIELYGPCPEPGHFCRECDHVYHRRRSKTYLKCEEWSDSSSEATDIRLKWPACGRFKKTEG